MKVTIYGDYVCPFCFLEVPALERLAAEEGLELDYRAYELRPEPVPTLEPRGEYLTRTWAESVYPLASRLGIPIQLPSVQPRSRKAFEGAEFAREHGRLPAYTRAVYETFFQKDLDISEDRVLAAVATEVGLDAGALLEAAHDQRYLARVLEQEREAARLRIEGVPMTFIGPHALPGLVSYDLLRRAVEAARSGS